MGWIKKHGITLILVSMVVIGIGLIAYPSVSNYWNTRHQKKVIIEYKETVSQLDAADRKTILGDAREYNRELAKTGIRWKMTGEEKREYSEKLRVDDSGVMAIVSIPKIRVELPIYHGTSDEVLQRSIGHIEGSSLPVGGESSHCLISGHRGLPSARLFTDLDQLKEGDYWTITVLNKTLTYEADQIRIVEPEDISTLRIEEGKDLCTLITCTPYGVNTHRLLVRGHRTANRDGMDNLADAERIDPKIVALFISVIILLIMFAGFVLKTAKRKKRTVKDKENAEAQ